MVIESIKEQARSSGIRHGDVILIHNPFVWYKPMTWLYALIRFFTKSNFNHAAVIVEVEQDLFVVEANAKGVVMIGLERWWKRAKRTCIVARTAAHQFVSPLKYLGIGYQFSLYISYLLSILFKKEWSDLRVHKTVYCFELAAYCFPSVFSYNKLHSLITANDFEKNKHFTTIYRFET